VSFPLVIQEPRQTARLAMKPAFRKTAAMTDKATHPGNRVDGGRNPEDLFECIFVFLLQSYSGLRHHCYRIDVANQ
jgi:hypothetical protein